jgi:hypothetical protein
VLGYESIPPLRGWACGVSGFVLVKAMCADRNVRATQIQNRKYIDPHAPEKAAQDDKRLVR